jgi:hypothetical protein
VASTLPGVPEGAVSGRRGRVAGCGGEPDDVTDAAMTLLIDPPESWNGVAACRDHLREVEALPDTLPAKPRLVDAARAVLAEAEAAEAAALHAARHP